MSDSSPSQATSPLELNEESYQRVRLLIAYDGGAFHGFARNDGVRTVAGDLEAYLTRTFRHDIVVTGAGRTDKGVHAWGQVVHFDTWSDRLDLARLHRSLNSRGKPSLAIRKVDLVDHDFDARFSATSRTYRYTVLTSPAPNPFTAAYSWHLPMLLSVDDMNAAVADLMGNHDFSAFCKRPPFNRDGTTPSRQRTLHGAAWTTLDDGVLQFEVTGRAFCHQMVRSIVGTLVDVGRGFRKVGDVAGILASKDRINAGDLAPPHGLCLYEVGYE